MIMACVVLSAVIFSLLASEFIAITTYIFHDTRAIAVISDTERSCNNYSRRLIVSADSGRFSGGCLSSVLFSGRDDTRRRGITN